jgi:hypothetical protein
MGKLAPEFGHDVFVSYSHGDAEGTGSAPLKTWSLGFARELERELRTLPDLQRATVFVDQSKRADQGLDASDPLTQQLRTAVSGAALLVVLMSPQYLRSVWCRDERDWWFAQAAAQPFPEIGSRLLAARVWPLGDERWPKEMCDEMGHPPLGVWFHEQPGDIYDSRPFGWPDPTSAGGAFREALVKLVGTIAKRIARFDETLVRRRQAANDLAKLTAQNGQAIYVHARMQDRDHWEDTIQSLLNAGYGAFPSTPEADYSDPRKAVDADNEMVKTLSACDALLLVGNNPQRLVSDLVVIGHQRRNSARAWTRRPLPCAVVDRGLAMQGESHLRNSAKNLHIDWINATTAGWIDEVRTWLNSAGASLSNAS